MTQTATKPSSIWNEVAFTGFLGKDPEMSFTPKGTPVTKMSLAVSQGKDKPPMWLSVECWKELAEHCNVKLTKGARVEIKGRLFQDSWDGKDGKKQYRFKVTAQAVRLLKSAEGGRATGFIDEEGTTSDALGELDDHPF